jgi:hypothetical protein
MQCSHKPYFWEHYPIFLIFKSLIINEKNIIFIDFNPMYQL